MDADHRCPSRWAILAITAATAIVFLPTVDDPFLLDSILLIRENSLVTGELPIHEVFTHQYWWPWSDSGYYRPLTILSYRVHCHLAGGIQPADFHVANILLHALNGILLYLILLNVFGRPGISVASALVFIVHPINLDTITNVTGRADELVLLSTLLCVLLYLPAGGGEGSFRRSPGRIRIGMICLLYFAGMLAKENAVLIPLTLLACDWVCSPREGAAFRWRGRMRVYGPLTATFGLAMAARAWALGDGTFGSVTAMDPPLEPYSHLETLLTAVKSLGMYLLLMIWPDRLSIDYSFDAVTKVGLRPGLSDLGWMVLGLAAFAALIWTARSRARQSRGLTFCALFVLAHYIPIFAGTWAFGGRLEPRWLYAPLCGLIPAGLHTLTLLYHAAIRAAARTAEGRAWPCRIAFGLIFLAAAGRSLDRARDWNNAVALATATRADTPRACKCRYALAAAWFEIWRRDPDAFSQPGSADHVYADPEFARHRKDYLAAFPDDRFRKISLLDLIIEETHATVYCLPGRTQPKEFLELLRRIRRSDG